MASHQTRPRPVTGRSDAIGSMIATAATRIFVRKTVCLSRYAHGNSFSSYQYRLPLLNIDSMDDCDERAQAIDNACGIANDPKVALRGSINL
eukprot:6180590-Pleurochrysis_carterae.AAC.3